MGKLWREKKISTLKDTESNPKKKKILIFLLKYWKYLVLKTALIFVPA